MTEKVFWKPLKYDHFVSNDTTQADLWDELRNLKEWKKSEEENKQ